MLTVGVPREVKDEEHRVAITPDGVSELTHRSVPVLIEHDAGAHSGISDDDYRAAGAEIVPRAEDVWARAGLVLKVKEPQQQEFAHLRPDLVLFTYLHLAAYPEVARALLKAGTTGVAYETVQLANGQLPLLAPMSEVAGRMAPQIGAHFLERARTEAGACCSVVHPAFDPRASSCSARATSVGTRRGSRRAWKPRCSSSTRTSTGSAGSTRSTRVGS